MKTQKSIESQLLKIVEDELFNKPKMVSVPEEALLELVAELLAAERLEAMNSILLNALIDAEAWLLPATGAAKERAQAAIKQAQEFAK